LKGTSFGELDKGGKWPPWKKSNPMVAQSEIALPEKKELRTPPKGGLRKIIIGSPIWGKLE